MNAGPRIARPIPAGRLWAAGLLVVALAAAVYAPVVRFPFVDLDDPYYVCDNADLAAVHGSAALRYAFTSTLGGNWHPLVWLSYLADRDVWHLRPGPMHAENAALHAASAVLALLLLADATGRLGRAAVCTAVFAVHPLHVESVAWVSERKDTLSTVWLLAAACCYVRFAKSGPPVLPRDPSPGRRWYAAMLVCYGLSLSAKSMGVTLPGVLLLLDGWPLGRLRGAVWPRVREKVPLLAMAAAAAVVAAWAQGSVGATAAVPTTTPDRLGNAAVSAVRYLLDSVWPTRLAVFYPFRPVPPAAAIAAGLTLVTITAVAVRARRRRPYLLVGWLWFGGTLLPVSGAVVQVGMQARADRYVYFPSVGLGLAVVWLAADVLTGRLRAGVASVAVAALAVVGRHQVGYWRDNTALFAHAVAVTDGNYLALDQVARGEMDRDLPAAVAHLTAALDARPDFAPAHADLGRCAVRAHDPADAVNAFAAAVRYAPTVAAYQHALDVARAALAASPRSPPR